LTVDHAPLVHRRWARRLLVAAGLAGGAWLIGAAMDSGSAQAAPAPAPAVLSQLAPVTPSLSATVANMVASVPTPGELAANPVDGGVASVPVTVHAAASEVPGIATSIATSVPAAVNSVPATIQAVVTSPLVTVSAAVDSVIATVTATVTPVVDAVGPIVTPSPGSVLDATRLRVDGLISGGFSPQSEVFSGVALSEIGGKDARSATEPGCGIAAGVPTTDVSALPQPPVVPATPGPPFTPAPGAGISASTGSASADRLLPSADGLSPLADVGPIIDSPVFVPAVRFDAPTFSPD
jgi:hypothetical protein